MPPRTAPAVALPSSPEGLMTPGQLGTLSAFAQQIDSAIDSAIESYTVEDFVATAVIGGVPVYLERKDNIVVARLS